MNEDVLKDISVNIVFIKYVVLFIAIYNLFYSFNK